MKKPKDPFKQGLKASWQSLISDALLAIIKLFFGAITGSYALLADGLHSATDAAGDLAVLIAFLWSRKPSDKDHPFGHGKIETLWSSLQGLFLISVGTGLIYEAWTSQETSLSENNGYIASGVLIASFFLKMWLYKTNLDAGKAARSNALIANAWQHQGDVWSTAAALAGVLGSLYGYPSLDLYAGGAVGCLIAITGIKLLIQSSQELLEASVDQATLNLIHEASRSPDIRSIHGVRARNIGSLMHIEVHLVVEPTLTILEGHEISELAEKRIRNKIPMVQTVMIHLDPYDDHDEDISRAHAALRTPKV